MDKSENFDQILVKELRLSRRTFNALNRNRVFTVGKLKELLRANELEKFYFIGKKSLAEISNVLEELPKYHLPDGEAKLVPNNLSTLPNESTPEDNKRESVKILELRASVRGALIKSGIKTVGDLMKMSGSELLKINDIGPKTLLEIRQALENTIGKYSRHVVKQIDENENAMLQDGTIKVKEDVVEIEAVPTNWAAMIQIHFEREKGTHTYVLISRFGYRPKKLTEIAEELGITRERVRQIQEASAIRFLRFLRFSNTAAFLKKIRQILIDNGDKLSLIGFKKLLQESNLLGQFSEDFKFERLEKLDPLEILICWLKLLADKRYNMQPVVFPIDVHDLIRADQLSIKDHITLLKLSSIDRKKIRRKVFFTGGITLRESANILSTDEKGAVLVLERINFQRIDKEWFSFKDLDEDKDNSKIPLRIAGLKMLAITPKIELTTFHEGLRRHASRFYTSIAPVHVINHVLPKLGFEIENSKVTTQLSTLDILSQSEKSLISAIRKNEGVASFLEVAEEFFLQNLSLPAVAVTLRRSPIVEKADETFYKLRGTEVSWQDIEIAHKRQKRFAQDNEITHGLDGIVRMRFTVNSYAFLTGVIGAYSIKGLAGSWTIIHEGTSFGKAKIDEPYLWGLAKLFKKASVQMGDRMELALNTWNRTLTVQKVKNENP